MKIKKTYLCRENFDFNFDTNIPADYAPQVGDVGIFKVMKIGKHRNVQSEWKRNMALIPGDLIMAAFGNRYATNQFEGYVPEKVPELMHMLAAGGVVGIVKSMHYNLEDIGPTIIEMKGLVRDVQGHIINTIRRRRNQIIPFSGNAAKKTKVILSLGSSMDSGKTTTAAYLVNGIRAAGHKVGFIKLTGTTHTKDSDLNFDLGAEVSYDFSEMGYPSTFLCSKQEILDLYETLLEKTLLFNPEYVVVEIADGLYQRETKMLYQSKEFMSTVHAVLFSAGDSLSALHGCQLLKSEGITPMALSGWFTASPLLIKEVLEHRDSEIPVVNLDELRNQADQLILRKAHSVIS
jgi:hypothetical protein